MKPKRTTFDVATMAGREQRTGYVLGDFATHKGRYFWTFTHVASGVAINVYPPHETKESALAHLEKLRTEGPPEYQRAVLARTAELGFGLGLAPDDT
jgi:hypothetical protein